MKPVRSHRRMDLLRHLTLMALATISVAAGFSAARADNGEALEVQSEAKTPAAELQEPAPGRSALPQDFAVEPPAAPGAEIRERAAEAYARGEWQEAIAYWEQLLEQGVVSAELYYNLGTAYAQAGDVGTATWMLLKAQRLAPRDPDIRENLETLNPDIYQQIAFFPAFPLEYLYRLFTLNEWAGAAAGATVAAALLACLALVTRRGGRGRQLLRRLAWTAAVVAVIAHAFAGVRYWDEIYKPSGVIIAAETYPRAAPSENAETYAFELPPGTIVRIEDAGQIGWVKAVYGGRNEVFLRREQVRIL